VPHSQASGQYTVTDELMMLGGEVNEVIGGTAGSTRAHGAVASTLVRAGVQGFERLAVSFCDHELCVVRHEGQGVTVLVRRSASYIVPQHLYDEVPVDV